MLNLNRRQTVRALVGLTSAAAPWAASVALAQVKPSAQAATVATPKFIPSAPLGDKLRFVIPANAGGGWDSTGRMIGISMVASGACSEAVYDNKGGKGGVIGLQYFHENFANDPNTLLVGGTVMVGSVALNKPAVDMSKVKALARLTSEYVVALVLPDSRIRNVDDLSKNLRQSTKDVAFIGGSLGGVDHIFAGLLARASGGDAKQLKYSAFSSGKDDVMGVLNSGRADIVLTGHSEAIPLIQSQRVRALGISTRKSQFSINSFSDQGLKADISNWRGLLVAASMPAARIELLANAVKSATSHPSWVEAVRANKANSSVLTGSAFDSIVENDILTARVMVHLLGLKT